jgi:hypothetical protein
MAEFLLPRCKTQDSGCCSMNMSPPFSTNNIAYVREGDAILISDLKECCLLWHVFRTYCSDDLFRDFRTSTSLSSRTSSSLRHVAHIPSVASYFKVIGIYARRIVAFVHNFGSARNRPSKYEPRGSVGIHRPSTGPRFSNLAVSFRHFRCCPKPATIRFVDLFQESLLKSFHNHILLLRAKV